uniref:Uncharacterized protein n=1 Tax=Peronospora matthiolae TaxID=2874970 RepID=A0AAV1TQD7_9STRA
MPARPERHLIVLLRVCKAPKRVFTSFPVIPESKELPHFVQQRRS